MDFGTQLTHNLPHIFLKLPLVHNNPLFLVFQKRVADDISRRLQVMSQNWTNGKLSQGVKSRMIRLAKGIAITYQKSPILSLTILLCGFMMIGEAFSELRDKEKACI